MKYTFSEFSTGAIFNIGNSDDLNPFKKAQQVNLYTFIWARSQPIELIVDSIPITLPSNNILALTPIQYIQNIDGNDAGG